ncbi:MAG: protein kinase family protein [Alphaproteobacteria bacterium]
MDVMAMVCAKEVPVRTDALQILRGMDHPNMMNLVNWATAIWPASKQERLFLVFDRPPGDPLLANDLDPCSPLSEEQAVSRILRPGFSLLSELASNGVYHGGIRPSNIFLSDASGSSVVFGQCASVPPGYTQHRLFETIDRAMCHPAGRGPGTAADDIYALGITMMVMLLGRMPFADHPETLLLDRKISMGTYPALVGRQRVGQALVEPLRGMLIDDPKQRWSLREIDLWLNGRRLSPRQPEPPKRVARNYHIEGREYNNLRSLSKALADNHRVGVKHITSGSLLKWMNRGAGIPHAIDLTEQAIATASQKTRAGRYDANLVSRVCIALDPQAPIRYRNCSFTLGGVGSMFTESVLIERDTYTMPEAVASQVISFWYNLHPEPPPDAVATIRHFDQVRQMVDRPLPGYGIERALYELNHSVPCMSPVLDEYYVLTLTGLIRCLERVAGSSERPKEPVDRHIAAFYGAREKSPEEWTFKVLAPGIEDQKRYKAMLVIMAAIQAAHDRQPKPKLAGWFKELLKPSVESLRNKRVRKRMDKEIKLAVDQGDLHGLLRLVDDPKIQEQDSHGFEAAKRNYRMLVAEIERLKLDVDDPTRIGRTKGHHWAAVISSILATVGGVCVVLFMGLVQ